MYMIHKLQLYSFFLVREVYVFDYPCFSIICAPCHAPLPWII